MRISWFRATEPDRSHPRDDTAALLARLGATHDIAVVTETRAHEFVWTHARAPYDLCVYELGDDPAHAFMHAYLAHYPGIVVAANPDIAEAVAALYPDARLFDILPCMKEQPGGPEIVVELEWPPRPEAIGNAVAGMAAGKAVIVFEIDATAGWPALNPQTWRPRGVADGPPIVVSIDPRDEAHSLAVAMRRLSGDPALRAQLGAAARAWWSEHGTVEGVARAWEEMLAKTAARGIARRGGRADGTERAKEILGEMGVEVDLF